MAVMPPWGPRSRMDHQAEVVAREEKGEGAAKDTVVKDSVEAVPLFLPEFLGAYRFVSTDRTAQYRIR